MDTLNTGAGGVFDENQLTLTFKDIDEQFDGMYDEFGNTADEFFALRTGIKQDRVQAARRLADEGIFGKDAIEKSGFFGIDAANVDMEEILKDIEEMFKDGKRLTQEQIADLIILFGEFGRDAIQQIKIINDAIITETTEIFSDTETEKEKENISELGTSIQNLTEDIYNFGSAREELFFGGKYGNVTGSLYKQVVKQGVVTLYNKMDIVMTNNFNGFFNEEEAAQRIINVLNEVAPSLTTQ